MVGVGPGLPVLPRELGQLPTIAVGALTDRAPGPIAARLGRYVILDLLGVGGMGIVYSGFDPQLDRRVALKVLKTEVGGEDDRRRLLREAKTMARLTHPNVVAIFDAGDESGQVYIAMEYVRGSSLRRWLVAADHTWQEVVEIFRQAGQGLLAAHQAGLIHRDFKPDNVLITEAGIAKVADFGLARAGESETKEEISLVRADTIRASEILLSRAGMLVGTPAYMSPEQYLGLEADARSDQFSFFVALYEALYRQLPFEGNTLQALAANVTSGHRSASPPGRGIPGWIHDVIARGLAPHREDRWPNMADVLAALSIDPKQHTHTRRQRALVTFSLVTGAIGAFAFFSGSPSPDGQTTCGGGAALRSAAWGSEQRRAVEGAILGSGVAYAADTWVRVDEDLGRYIAAWEVIYREGCETHQRGEISDEFLDRSVACLQQRRREFSALVGVLARTDAEVVAHAVEAVGQLQPPEACGDAEALASASAVAVDPAKAEAIERTRDTLARARALVDAAVPRLAEVELAGVVERARELAHLPLVVEALHVEGSIRRKLGKPAAAEVSLLEAYQRAEVIAAEHEKIEITVELVEVVGYHLARPREAAVWAVVGEAAARRIGAADQALARLDNAMGIVLAAQGRRAEARERYGAALEIHNKSGTKPGVEAARVLNNLGQLSYADGDLDEAARRYQQALTIYEAALGPRHPDLGGPLNNLGNVEVSRAGGATKAAAHYEGGRGYYEKALEIYENAYGAGHPLLAFPLVNLGDVDFVLGHYVAAEARYARALAIREANYAADHPLLVAPLSNLGLVTLELGDAARARPLLERALAIGERVASPADELAETRFALARALWLTASVDESAAREHARGLAETARGGFAGEGSHDEVVSEIDRWLAEHPAPPNKAGRERR